MLLFRSPCLLIYFLEKKAGDGTPPPAFHSLSQCITADVFSILSFVSIFAYIEFCLLLFFHSRRGQKILNCGVQNEIEELSEKFQKRRRQKEPSTVGHVCVLKPFPIHGRFIPGLPLHES